MLTKLLKCPKGVPKYGELCNVCNGRSDSSVQLCASEDGGGVM